MLHQLRQQGEHRAGVPNRARADYVAPVGSGLPDHVGAFAVTAGIGLPERVKAFQAELDDYTRLGAVGVTGQVAGAAGDMLAYEKHMVRRWFDETFVPR